MHVPGMRYWHEDWPKPPGSTMVLPIRVNLPQQFPPIAEQPGDLHSAEPAGHSEELAERKWEPGSWHRRRFDAFVPHETKHTRHQPIGNDIRMINQQVVVKIQETGFDDGCRRGCINSPE